MVWDIGVQAYFEKELFLSVFCPLFSSFVVASTSTPGPLVQKQNYSRLLSGPDLGGCWDYCNSHPGPVGGITWYLLPLLRHRVLLSQAAVCLLLHKDIAPLSPERIFFIPELSAPTACFRAYRLVPPASLITFSFSSISVALEMLVSSLHMALLNVWGRVGILLVNILDHVVH